MTLDDFYRLSQSEQIARWDELSHADKIAVGERARTRVMQRRDQQWAWARENRRVIEAIANAGPDSTDELLHGLCRLVDYELKWRLVDGMKQAIDEIKAERTEPPANGETK